MMKKYFWAAFAVDAILWGALAHRLKKIVGHWDEYKAKYDNRYPVYESYCVA